MDAVVVVDKPQGPTSHDVVFRVRRLLGTREVGHAGTLDPMATGVLVVAIGDATKLVAHLTAQDKAYVATVRLGVTTASLDAEGAVTETGDVDLDVLRDEARLDAAFEAERLRTSQVPPVVSAIKVEGRSAHARVRSGEVLDLPPREVAVQRLVRTAVRLDPPEIDLEIACAKGYYVRALARDLALQLGTVGHLTRLRRTRSGPFTIDDAASLDAESLRAAAIPLAEAAARVLPMATLTLEGTLRARQGKRLDLEHFSAAPGAETSAWLDEHGTLVALGVRDADQWRVARGFRIRT